MRSLAILATLAAPTLAGAQEDLAFDPAPVAACLEAGFEKGAPPACIGDASGACMEANEGGFTTVGMSDCTGRETTEWDRLLNEEYRLLQGDLAQADARGSGLGAGIDRTDALRDAQRAWIAFRDADCLARYAQYQDGSIRSLIGSSCRLDHTARRTLELRQMRAGVDGTL